MGLISTRARILRALTISSRSPVRRGNEVGSFRLVPCWAAFSLETASAGTSSPLVAALAGCGVSAALCSDVGALGFLLHDDSDSRKSAVKRTAGRDKAIRRPIAITPPLF